MSMASQKTGHYEGYDVGGVRPDTKPGIVEIRVFGETYNTWPLHCLWGWKCVDCVFSGKIKCEPRFWGEGWEQLPQMVERHCIFCGAVFWIRSRELRHGKGMFCCNGCKVRVAWRLGLIPSHPRLGKLVHCHTCGKEIYRLRCNLKAGRLYYCSRSHQSSHLGKTYGFGVHPENTKQRRLVPVG